MKKVVLSSVLAVVVFALMAMDWFSPSSVNSGPVKGNTAPEIVLPGTNGKNVKLSSLKGKVVLIDFWASWCGPCRKENPNVVEAYNKYKNIKFKNGKGFEVFSVSLDREAAPWKEAIKKDGLIWKHHAWDKEGKVSDNYGVSSIPKAFLIDGEGKIIAVGEDLRGLGLHVQLDKLR